MIERLLIKSPVSPEEGSIFGKNWLGIFRFSSFQLTVSPLNYGKLTEG